MKTKTKKVLKRIGITLSAVIIALAIAAGAFCALYKPTVTFDAADLTGEVTSGASGFLYGIAQDGVPSYNMTESIDLSSLSTKTTLGLQHPIGEMSDIAPQALSSGNCDYLVVYLQDMYSTWYYDEDNINEMKKAGAYDWREYLENTYFPLVAQTVNAVKASDYHDKIVYCIYNECDNGVWFGEWVSDPLSENGGRNDFNEQGSQNFFEAWKLTYDYVRALDPQAVIGGPGYYEYDSGKMRAFLEYTSQNDCVPQVLIYHELNYRSIYDWQFNVADLKELEQEFGVDTNTPVIVTEYGMMEDNGNPNTMLKYITQIEYSKVYGQQAYWLFANNLCNTAADYNTPNSAWWVYRWYTDMQGQTMRAEISDILHSDIGKALLQRRAPRYRQFMGLGTVNNEKNSLELLVSGADYDGVVKIENMQDTALYGKDVYIEISAVTYQGISGEVYAPEKIRAYTEECSGTLTIDMDFTDDDTAYRITVREAQEQDEVYENTNRYTRYEFEDGELLGNAYTYDSAYASTGEQNGLVGGMENEGDGVRISVSVPESGMYEFKFIYGKANDGEADENGKQDPNDRVSATVDLRVGDETSQITLENTVRSEITSAYTDYFELEAGKYTVELTHNDGTYVLDSLLVKQYEKDTVCVLADADRSGGENTYFLAVAPQDGYYDIVTAPLTVLDIDGAPAQSGHDGTATVYLRRGLNYIGVAQQSATLQAARREAEMTAESIALIPGNAQLSGTAAVSENTAAGVDYISGISSEGGAAQYTFTAPESGTYKMTVTYSANREQGVHDYNVDLVEDYITLSVNGAVSQLYCRNTCSNDNFTTVTVNVALQAGENTLILYNDGSNQFNAAESFAPNISGISINRTQF